jgi:hypothetical protein
MHEHASNIARPIETHFGYCMTFHSPLLEIFVVLKRNPIVAAGLSGKPIENFNSPDIKV